MADNTNTLQLTISVKEDGTKNIEEISGKIKGLGDVTGDVTKRTKEAESAFGNLKTTYIELAAKIALVVAAYGQVKKYTWDLSKEIGSLNNDIQRQADILGMSTIEYQKWVYAAKMSDVQSQDLSLGFKLLARNIEETSRGTSVSTNYFALMGISLQDTSGRIRPFGDLMGDIADQFSRWEDGPKKIAIAMDLFGRSGEGLIPILNKGRQGIQEYFKEAQSLGVILDESIIKKGSEVEDILKRIDAQILANKMAMAPAALEYARFMGIMADGLGKLLTEREKDPIRNWLIRDLPAYVKKAGESIGILKKDIYTWPDETRFKLPQIKIPPPEPTKWGETISFSEMLQNAYTGLGITVDKTAESIKFDLDIIKTAYENGTASGLTYVKALTTAKNALDKLKPTGDLKERLKLEEEYQKKHNELTKMDPGPERRAEANKLTDWWLDEIKKLDAAKPPSVIDIPRLENEVKQSIGIIENLTKKIESRPIIQKIQIVQESGSGLSGTGIGYPSLTPSPSITGRPTWASDIGVNFDFTATGLSPKMPLGQGIERAMSKFTILEDKIQAMEATVEFVGLSDQLRALEKQYDLYGDLINREREYRHWFPASNPAEWTSTARSLMQFQEDLFEKMRPVLMQMALQKYKIGVPGAEEEFYSYLGSEYRPPVYQHGTPYVPETGLALIHRGERITPANQNFSMGGNKYEFHFHGGDPKRTADAVVNALEYHLSGRLRDAIRKIAK